MRKEQNIAQLLVASDFYNSAGTLDDVTDNQLAIVCVKDLSGDLSPGQLFTSGGQVVAEGDQFKLAVKRADGNVQWSDVVTKDGIYSLKHEAYSAPTEQIDFIGYDPVNDSGDLEVIDDNGYYASVTLLGSTKHDFARMEKLPAIYHSPESGNTGFSVAAGIASIFKANMEYYRVGYKPIKPEVVCDNAGTALDSLTAATGDITVKNNLKGIKAASDITGSGDITEGDLLRLGPNGDNTDGVYKVVSIDSGNNEAVLDRPYEQADATLDDANQTHIASGDISSAAFGVKIKGNTPDSIPGYVNFEPVRFNTGIFDMGSTNLSKSAQDASRGIGSYQYIQQLESQLKQNEGMIYRATPSLELPRDSYTSVVDANAGGFDVVSVDFRKKSANPLGDFTYSLAQVYIALDSDGSNNGNLATALGGEV